MNAQILNVIGSEWSNEVAMAVETVLTKLRDIPKMSKHIPYLDCILILNNPFDEGNHQYALGSYNKSGVIKLYANKITSIQQLIYVLLHEFSHHVAFQLAGLDSGYDSVKMNKAYLKEEIRADALAIMLLKKFFNADGKFVAVLKEAKERLTYMLSKFKGNSLGWQEGYTYTIHWSGWNQSKNAWRTLALAA